MQGGRRTGAGRKKKPDHLRRELVTIRLPQWMIFTAQKQRRNWLFDRKSFGKKLFLGFAG